MEIWSLRHPKHGLIEVERGFDAEFNELYEDWSEPTPTEDDGRPQDFITPPLTANLKERIVAKIYNPPTRLQIKVDGKPVRRFKRIETGRYPLRAHIGSRLSAPPSAAVPKDKPHLYILKNQFDELLQVEFREGSEVVEFEPPPGTRGAKRYAAMESSVIKRLLYPMLSGLGKGGWALAAILLGPIISQFIGWLLSFLPDWQMPSLPSLPQISLPAPELPQIQLPMIPWPNWDLPQFAIPAWVEFLLDYTKVWVPILIALIFALVALRNHKKSEQKKPQWKDNQGEGTADEKESECCER